MSHSTTSRPSQPEPIAAAGETAFRPDPRAEADLRRFFRDPEELTRSEEDDDLDPYLSATVERARVAAPLIMLEEEYFVTLGHYYTPVTAPAEVGRVLGPLATAVVLSPDVAARYAEDVRARRTTAKTIAMWLDELIARDGDQAVEPWRHRAERAYLDAMRAYQAMRAPGGMCRAVH